MPFCVFLISVAWSVASSIICFAFALASVYISFASFSAILPFSLISARIRLPDFGANNKPRKAQSGAEHTPPHTARTLHIQNGGLDVATVELILDSGPLCEDAVLCGSVVLEPGARYDASDVCPGAGRPIRVESDAPVAAVSSQSDGHRINSEAGSSTESGARVLAGPLWVDPIYFTATALEVANTSPDTEATVRAEFLNAAGETQFSKEIALCPLAAGTIALPIIRERFRWLTTGTLRVESLSVAGAPGPNILGTIHLTTGDADWGEGTSYSLLPPLSSDTASPIGVAWAGKDLYVTGYTSELAVANLERGAGWTDVALLLLDANGVTNSICMRLLPGDVRYIDLEMQGSISPGWVGSALAVPTRWNHEAPAGDARFGIGVVSVIRKGTRLPEDVPGDETAAVLGARLPSLTADLEAAAAGACGAGSSEPPAAVARKPGTAYMPVLRDQGALGGVCDAAIHIRNPGSVAVQGVVTLFGENGSDCAALIGVECTGLLAPGAEWLLGFESIPAEARSGAVIAFRDASVAEIGGPSSDSRGVAAAVCEQLRAGDCTAWRQLSVALDGGAFIGIPVAAGVAGPLEVEVIRECPDWIVPGLTDEASYGAVSDVGYQRGGQFLLSSPDVTASMLELNALIYVQNAGPFPASVSLALKESGDCLRWRTCGGIEVPAGGMSAFDVNDCIGPNFHGSVTISATGPIAAVIDKTGPITSTDEFGLITYPALSSREPFDQDGDGDVSSADVAIVEAALGSRVGDAGWDARRDVVVDGVISANDATGVALHRCGADTPPAPIEAPPPADSAAFAPLLNITAGGTTCDPTLIAQNLGRAAKFALLLFEDGGQDCVPPHSVHCSGLVAPGHPWHFGAIPATARSAMLFAVDARPLSAFGITRAGDPTAADALCESLRTLAVGDCGQFRAFLGAWRTGQAYDGLPFGHFLTPAVTLDVRRSCDDGKSEEAYQAIGSSSLGAANPDAGGYVTRLGMVLGDAIEFDAVLALQNTGPETASVALEMRVQDDCSRTIACPEISIPVGAVALVQPCTRPHFWGSATITSSQPLAVVADTSRGNFGLMTLNGIPQVASSGARLSGAQPRYGLEAYSPVRFHDDAGWDHAVQVTNVDTVNDALVLVEYREGNGAVGIQFVDRLCPAGAQTFFSPVIDASGPDRPGSVHVRSLPHPGRPAVPIMAESFAVRYSNAGRSDPVAMVQLPFTPRGGAAGQYRERSDGAAIVGLPGIDLAAGAHRLEVSNYVLDPGTTRVSVAVVDSNSVVALRCIELGPAQSQSIDLGELGLDPNFKGAAVISATSWTHKLPDSPGDRAIVGIGAALVRGLPGDLSSDEMSVSVGYPLNSVPAGFVWEPPSCPDLPTPTATPTRPQGTPATATPTGTIPPTRDPRTEIPETPAIGTPTQGPSPEPGGRLFLPFAEKVG
jgi:hypothetical protein